MGRPSKDLHVVIGVLLLQQLHDLSDAETVEALAFNMAWHYALDVRSEADSYFCEKTLRNYRRLFIEQGLDELLFRCLTDRLVQGFSVDTSHQRMDSTALRSAMRALTRLGIVVESISKFARELERYHPGLHEQISKEVIRRYVDREGNGAFANTAPSVSKRRLGEAGQYLLALVLQFRDTAAAKLFSFAILERVLRDQFEIVDDEYGESDRTQNWLNRSVQGGPHADNFEKKVAVDGPVINAGELGSSTFSPGQALPAGPLGLGQRWTVARKREVVLRLLRDEPVQLLSRQLGVEIFRLEQWREKAIGGIDASLKQRKGDPVQAELDSAMKRIGELTMQVELLEAKTETFGPLGRRRSRR